MKKYILWFCASFILFPNMLFADLVTLISGKKFEAIIKKETEEEVIFIRDTGEYAFPKAHIRFIERYGNEENKKLEDKWNAPDYSRSDNIITCYDKVHRYVVCLPTGYNKETKWPVLFCFDPNGVGAEAVSRFKEAAKKYNWIVVASLDAKNGPWEPIIKAQEAMIRDVTQRYNVDNKRFYAAGFSGGARMAYTIAYNNPDKFRGIIACGAGFGQGKIAKNIVVFHCIGKDDCNLREVKEAHRKLLMAGVESEISEFEGGHNWPPAEVISLALDKIAKKN